MTINDSTPGRPYTLGERELLRRGLPIEPIPAPAVSPSRFRAFAAPTSAPEGTAPSGVPACMRPVWVAATHPGVFHADDVLAAAILLEAFDDRVEMRRLERPSDAAAAAELYEGVDVVFDVGGAYEPFGGGSSPFSNRTPDGAGPVLLDHHQKGRAGRWRDGIELSSAGLVWCLFKHHFGLSSAVEELVEDRLIKPVDAVDNGQELLRAMCGSSDMSPTSTPSASAVIGERFQGVSMPSFTTVISGFNPSWMELANIEHAWPEKAAAMKAERFNLRFGDAVQFARATLRNVIQAAIAEVEAESRVEAALKTDRPVNLPDVVVFDRYYAGMIGGVLAAERAPPPEGRCCVQFVMYPDEQGTWLLQCVPPTEAPRDRFEQRTPLPAMWAGLRGAKLAEVTEVGDSVFCHPGRWICGAGSKEGALALARLALGR